MDTADKIKHIIAMLNTDDYTIIIIKDYDNIIVNVSHDFKLFYETGNWKLNIEKDLKNTEIKEIKIQHNKLMFWVNTNWNNVT